MKQLIFTIDRETRIKSEDLYLPDQNGLSDGEIVLNTDQYAMKSIVFQSTSSVYSILLDNTIPYSLQQTTDKQEPQSSLEVKTGSVSENALLKALAIVQNPELSKELIKD